MTPERVSLCIPVFRSAAFLPELFSHLRVLRPAPAEIVFLDDASPDESGALVSEFIRSMPRDMGLRLLVNDRNAGISAAYNRLAQEASCAWVHILDADDYPVQPDFYAGVARSLRPEYDVVVTALRSNSALLHLGATALSWLVPNKPPLWWPLLGSFATRSGVLYRRSALLRQAFPDPAFPGSDIVHLLHMRQRGHCSYRADLQVFYRVHSAATSSGPRDYGRYRASLGAFGIATRWALRVDLALRTLGQRIAR